MNNIIELSARREDKSRRLKYVIGLVLARDQSLIVGTANPKLRYNELRDMFPEAQLEMMKYGVKVCRKK